MCFFTVKLETVDEGCIAGHVAKLQSPRVLESRVVLHCSAFPRYAFVRLRGSLIISDQYRSIIFRLNGRFSVPWSVRFKWSSCSLGDPDEAPLVYLKKQTVISSTVVGKLECLYHQLVGIAFGVFATSFTTYAYHFLHLEGLQDLYAVPRL